MGKPQLPEAQHTLLSVMSLKTRAVAQLVIFDFWLYYGYFFMKLLPEKVFFIIWHPVGLYFALPVVFLFFLTGRQLLQSQNALHRLKNNNDPRIKYYFRAYVIMIVLNSLVSVLTYIFYARVDFAVFGYLIIYFLFPLVHWHKDSILDYLSKWAIFGAPQKKSSAS